MKPQRDAASQPRGWLLSKPQKMTQVLKGVWRTGALPYALLVGMENGAAAVENSMEGPQEIRNKTTIRSSNSTYGHLFE